jgi:hypothetical protein
MSTFSDLKFELIGTGEQAGTWGNTTNTNLGTAVEEAITGSADVSFSSSDVTLTLTNLATTQAGRNLRLNLTGTSGGARNLILGSDMQINKLYLVNNTLLDAVTVKNTTGTGIAVPAGKTMFVFNNGTNVVDAVTHLSSLTLGSALPVASGGTGITSFGTGVATFLGTPSSANLAAAVTDETGSGLLVFATSPTLESPVLGTPTSGALTTCTADGTNPVGFKNIPLSGTKTASYILVAGDVGKFVELGASGTIVIPASVFAAGDAISVFNNTSASIACTCSAITTVYEGGTNTNISATGFSSNRHPILYRYW